jgi:nucleolin
MNVDYTTDRSKAGAGNTDRKAATSQRADRYGDKKSEPNNTLFLGNLSFDADNNAVQQAFEEFGTINRVSLPTDRETGAPKGFGYIDFATVEEATAAFEAMNGADIAGRAIRIDYASARPDNGGDRGGFGGGRGGGGGRGRGGFGDRGGGRGGGRGGFGDRRGGGGFGGGRGGGGRGGGRGGGGFGFSGNKKTFD